MLIEDPLLDPFYADPRIEIQLSDAAVPRQVTLPQDGFHGSLAYRRRQTLARYLAGTTEAETASNELARSILTHYNAQAGDELTSRRHLPLDPESAASHDLERSDPDSPSRYTAVLQFEVVIVDVTD